MTYVTKAELALPNGAELVGCVQGTSGAVTRTVQDKLRDYLDVKDFGAVGDGVTDDTSAIQTAIDAWANGTGAEIHFPKGEYLISDTLVIPAVLDAKLTLAGAGAKLVSTHAGPLIDNNNEFTTFRDLWLSGPGAGAAGSVGLATSLYAGLIDNLRLDHFETGLKLQSITGTVRRLHSGACGQCVYIEDFSNVLTFSDCYFTSSDTGIYVPNTSNGDPQYVAQLMLVSCTFEVMGRGVWATSTINRFSAFNCWTERGTVGSFVLQDTPAYLFNCNFVDHVPQISFTGGFPAGSKQWQMIDCYEGQKIVSADGGDTDLITLQNTAYPNSGGNFIAGHNFFQGNGYRNRIGFWRNAVVVDAPNLLPLVDAGCDLGAADTRFKALFLSSQVTVAGNKVVGSRRTGWQAPTGTASRATFDPAAVSLQDLAQRVKALVDDLSDHGLIGA
jgi:hypothetical protein